MSFRIIQSIQYFVIAKLANYTPTLTNGLVFGYRLINLKLLKALLQVIEQLAIQGKKHIVYFVGIALLQLVSSVMVLIYILCLPARSKEVKHYGLKCLSTPQLPLIGLPFLKVFQNMTLSHPADR